jgi:hypothetical protein
MLSQNGGLTGMSEKHLDATSPNWFTQSNGPDFSGPSNNPFENHAIKDWRHEDHLPEQEQKAARGQLLSIEERSHDKRVTGDTCGRLCIQAPADFR